MRESGPFLPGRLGSPPTVGESWRRHAVRHFLLVLVLLASAPLQAQQPVITSVVNAASYAEYALVPGGIATLFGTGIVSASGILEAAAVPLPTTLGGTQVLVNNIPAPLFAVAKVNRQEQINFQVPWEVAGASLVDVVVVNGSARNARRHSEIVRDAAPGLFTLDGASAIVVHGATNQLVTAANPAEPNEAVVFYATGLGAVDRAQQSGRPASLTELARVSNTLTVKIGGQTAAVQFAGLTPGSIGLYQVNCTVPYTDVSGELEVQMTMFVTMFGQSSKPAKMSVRGGIAESFEMEFVQIQPGEFTMGCSPGNSECYSEESPAHRVRITRGFQIGKYEVTQEQWQAVMWSNPSYFKGATLPEENVTWYDVQEFLRRLNARNDGFRYRPPTEAEWEYAARAGTTDKYGGGGPLEDVAWYGDNSGGTTHPVGQKRPNAWGLYDMLGNVAEWCQDWYDGSRYSSSPVEDPAGPFWSIFKILRGGSWAGVARRERVSARDWEGFGQGERSSGLGFRCAREVIPGVMPGSLRIEFVQIQPGEFAMGCSPGDSECWERESPAHRVRITRGFQMGKYEVTQEQWQAVMGSNPSDVKGATLPVEQVSWDDIQGFLQRLNARNDGYRYRLPTEAEWEYAARAGTTDKYAGANALEDVAWYGSNSGKTTHPVGQKRPNAWGLYDMLGNAWEWCQDWYGASYYASGPAENPAGPSSGSDRVFRGGAWFLLAWNERVSYRGGSASGYRDYGSGFRCVRELIP